jgi:hypothetical protein
MRKSAEPLVIFNCNTPERYCLVETTDGCTFSEDDWEKMREQVGVGPYMAFFWDEKNSFVYRLLGPYIGKKGHHYFAVNWQNIDMSDVVQAIRKDLGDV